MIDMTTLLVTLSLIIAAIDALWSGKGRQASAAIAAMQTLLLISALSALFFGWRIALPTDPYLTGTIKDAMSVAMIVACALLFALLIRRTLREETERVAALED